MRPYVIHITNGSYNAPFMVFMATKHSEAVKMAEKASRLSDFDNWIFN